MNKSAKFASFALLLSLALVAWFAVAAFGPKFGLFSWKIGFGTMTAGWGIYLIGAVALVAAIALIAVLIRAPRKGWARALVALLIPAAFFFALGSVKTTADSVPPIHDVSTNLVDPPMYSQATLDLRTSLEANPINDFQTPLGQLEMWQGERFADVADKTAGDLIADAFPRLQTVRLALPADQAIDRVSSVMTDAGLHDVKVRGSQIEGVAETFLYGFRDDVVARVRPANGGSEVDFRSTSRVGLSDLGVNAKRVADLIDALNAET